MNFEIKRRLSDPFNLFQMVEKKNFTLKFKINDIKLILGIRILEITFKIIN